MKQFFWINIAVLGLVFLLGCGGGQPSAGDAAHDDTVAEQAGSERDAPALLENPMNWLLLLAAAAGIVVFAERYLLYHRVQINTTEFVGGLGNVLSRGNIVEAISICEATPSPAARLVREVIVNRDRSRDELKETLEAAGAGEVARLERNLWVLATVGQVAPLLGLLGTVLGFMTDEVVTNLHAHFSRALTPTALGLAIGIPAYAAYNFLVAEIGSLVLAMEKTSLDAVRMVEDLSGADTKLTTRRGAKKK
tara:strand:+ start:191 stop:943 length:753 start_codon:yes stop_codon:yes gene_type:complete